MRMSNKMRELRNQINRALDSLNAAVEAENAEDARGAKENLENLNALYAAAEAEFNARRSLEIDPDEEDGETGDPSSTEYNAQLFYKAISHQPMNDAERNAVRASRQEYSNRFSEGSQTDGGYTVPDDLSTEIFESIQSKESVRNLVHVENVKSATGTRIFRDGEPIKLYNTAEYEEIKEMANRQYKLLHYKQKKFAGLMTVSSELLQDSFVNFKSEFVEWMSDAARNTENAQIFYGAGGENHCEGMLSTAGAYQEIAVDTLSIDYLRRVYLTVKSGYRANSKWIMNSLMFAEISNLKYQDGKSCIQPDPRTKDSYMLLGYPIAIYDEIQTDEDKTIIAFGDFDRAYRMFSRREFGVSFTDVGAGAFETDSLKARGTERFDGKIFDRSAIVIVRGIPVSPVEITGGTAVLDGEMTEATLKNLTKKQLVELADELDITGVDASQTKDAIVTAILAGINTAGEAGE